MKVQVGQDKAAIVGRAVIEMTTLSSNLRREMVMAADMTGRGMAVRAARRGQGALPTLIQGLPDSVKFICALLAALTLATLVAAQCGCDSARKLFSTPASATLSGTGPADQAAANAADADNAERLGEGMLMLLVVDLTTSMTPRWLPNHKQQQIPVSERNAASRELATTRAMQLAQAAPRGITLLILAYADKQTWQVYYGPARGFDANLCQWPTAPRGSVSNHQLPARELLKYLALADSHPFMLYWVSDFCPTGGKLSSITTRKYGEPRLPAGMPATELLTHPSMKSLTLLMVDVDQATQLKAALAQAQAIEPEIVLVGQQGEFSTPSVVARRLALVESTPGAQAQVAY